MASAIQTYLNNILNTVYGRDVRSSIHDAIELCYSDVSSGKTIAEAAAETIGTATTAATNAANAANAAATAANAVITAAETAASDAATAASDATTAATAANSAATAASNSADLAEAAASAANNAVSAANTAVDAANAAIEIIGSIDVDASEALTVITNATNAANAANAAAADAANAVTAAENAAQNASSRASAAESAANSCNTAITYANLAASGANSAKDAANTAASNANNARDAATTAATAANSAASAASNAAINANAAITSANSKIAAMDAKIFDAESATNSANTAASNANTAAISANTAAATINGLTVDSEDVGPNIPASAVLQTIDGHKNIHFLLRQGATGAAFTIKGSAYATVAALQEAITTPEVGDQYNVGANPPYHVYRWTGSNWEDQGTIGSDSDPITAQDVQAIQNGREIESASTKVMKVEALTYLIHNVLINLLNAKVDKVTGKGLSTNDFTNDDKSALTSATSAIASLSSSKVDKITGKGLSTNDFTTAFMNKVTMIGDDTLGTSAATITAAINELLTNKAPIDSPLFTGNARAPTVSSSSDSTNKIATTEFVQTVVSNIAAEIPLKAPIDSPSFTGTPTAPTPATSTNSTRVATTAYVQSNFTAKSNIYATNITVNNWQQESTPTYAGYPYRASLTAESLANVTSTMYAEVIFNPTEAVSGNYAPVCQTYNGGVYIYSKVNSSIVVATVVVMRW